MPQYNSPSLITSFLGADIVLIWQTSSGAVKTITGQNLATSLQELMTFTETVSFITSSTLLSDQQVVVANSGATFTLTLPTAMDYEGKRYTIYNRGAGVLTVARTGTDTIGGATSLTLAQFHGYSFVSDGIGNWMQIGQ